MCVKTFDYDSNLSPKMGVNYKKNKRREWLASQHNNQINIAAKTNVQRNSKRIRFSVGLKEWTNIQNIVTVFKIINPYKYLYLHSIKRI